MGGMSVQVTCADLIAFFTAPNHRLPADALRARHLLLPEQGGTGRSTPRAQAAADSASTSSASSTSSSDLATRLLDDGNRGYLRLATALAQFVHHADEDELLDVLTLPGGEKWMRQRRRRQARPPALIPGVVVRDVNGQRAVFME